LPAGLDFLTALVANKDTHARAALTALAIHRHYPKIRDAIAAAVAANGEPAVEAWFRKKFAENDGTT
jgi:hypothetical protein